MPAFPGSSPLDEISVKWRDLAQRRLVYFTELYRSGRWQHYYTPEAFTERMRDVVKATKACSQLAERATAERILATDMADPALKPLPELPEKYRPAA